MFDRIKALGLQDGYIIMWLPFIFIFVVVCSLGLYLFYRLVQNLDVLISVVENLEVRLDNNSDSWYN
jgi:hypothetical protein